MSMKPTVGIVNPVAKAMLQKTNPNVGANKKHNDDWKRERKLARKHKLQARKVA